MEDDRIKWIWLSSKHGITPIKINMLLEHFGGIDNIYEAEKADYEALGAVSERDAEALADKSLDKADKIYEKTVNAGIRAICPADEEYPKRFLKLHGMPYVLYAKGPLLLKDIRSGIGVVGTRQCSDYGKNVTYGLCRAAAEEGFVIVSGLARGVDAVAAAAAVNSGTPTAAVLGCGVDVIYPAENKEIYNAIAENGVLISEYPVSSPPVAWHFPPRNRIIAALAEAVVVTEAPKGSGALITAKYAMDMGKRIYAVPGSVFSENYVGTNLLLKNGAYPAVKPGDITEGLLPDFPKKEKGKDQKRVSVPKTPEKKPVKRRASKKPKTPPPEKQKEKPSLPEGLSDGEKLVAGAILSEGRISGDELARKCGLDAARLNPVLTMLEIKGAVKKYAGNFYEIKNN